MFPVQQRDVTVRTIQEHRNLHKHGRFRVFFIKTNVQKSSFSRYLFALIHLIKTYHQNIHVDLHSHVVEIYKLYRQSCIPNLLRLLFNIFRHLCASGLREVMIFSVKECSLSIYDKKCLFI